MQDLSQYTKRTHVEIQTKYLTFLIVTSIAIVGLVFAAGVLVGSRQSDKSACPKIDALAALDNSSMEPLPPVSGLSFHESLVAQETKVPTPASLLKEKRTSLDSIQNDKIMHKELSLEPAIKENPVLETVPYDEPGRYSLQVGSFQNRGEANEMIRKLHRAGYGVFLVSVNMPDRGGLWYRVRVGPFKTKKEVWGKKKLFEEKERIPAFVVKKRV